MNSIAGPPTNLAVTPSGDIAIVAKSLMPVVQGWAHRLDPDDKVFVVDLKASPPNVIGTVKVGKQFGSAISPKGDLAFVANRGDGTLSVLAINGKNVLVTGTVSVGTATDLVSAVAITPDGRHALAAKPGAKKVAMLAIDADKVSYDNRDLPIGIYPYNVAVTPDGKLALTADTGVPAVPMAMSTRLGSSIFPPRRRGSSTTLLLATCRRGWRSAQRAISRSRSRLRVRTGQKRFLPPCRWQRRGARDRR